MGNQHKGETPRHDHHPLNACSSLLSFSGLAADLQDFNPAAPNYYPDPHQIQQPYAPPMGYGHQNHGGAPNYYGPNQQQQGHGHGYGTVSYTVGNGGQASFDSGKSIASLSSFIGDVQRGAIDMKNFSQVSNRLVPLQKHGVQYLVGGMADYQPVPVEVNVEGQGSVYGPTAQYSLPPLDSLRTKDQLLDMARRFEQMASTVYDIAEQTSAAGTGQADVHYVENLSPPGVQLQSNLQSAIATASSGRSNHSGTPVLSPPSSAGGYTSGHSPDSNHSNPRLSPATPNAQMYPILPGPSSVGYPPSSMGPTATLGTQLDNDYRPRRGGGYLQKARPVHSTNHEDRMDTSQDNGPRAPVAQMQPKADYPNSNIDPALSGEEPSSSAATNEATEDAHGKTSAPAADVWLNTVRIVEALRKYVAARLDNGDYENENGEAKREAEGETPGLYPALNSVQVGA